MRSLRIGRAVRRADIEPFRGVIVRALPSTSLLKARILLGCVERGGTLLLSSRRAMRGAAALLAATFFMSCSDSPVSTRGSAPGSIAWRVADIRSPFDATDLASDAQRVYAYRDGLSISAVRLADRAIVWTAKADETFDNNFSPRGLTRCGSAVVFGSAAALYGVSPDDGSRLWRWRPSKGGQLGYSTPRCNGTIVYFGTGRPMFIYAVDANSGAELWSSDFALDPASNGFVWTPRFSDGVVVGCTREFTRDHTGMIAAVDAATGARLWQYTWSAQAPTTDASCASPMSAAGGIAVGAADDGRIFGLDLRTGELRWTAPRVPGYTSSITDQRPTVIADSLVIAGSGSGVITGYDLTSGAERWRTVDPKGAIYSVIMDPFVAGNGVAIAMNTGGFGLAFDVSTGRRRWTFTPSGNVTQQILFGPGVLTDSLIIAVGSDGLYALRR